MNKKSTALAIISSFFLSSSAFAWLASDCIKNPQNYVYEMGENNAYANFGFCNIHDADLPGVVAFLNKNPQIKQVDLSHNHIHAQGAAHLKQLANVNWLDLSSNYLGAEGAISVASNDAIEVLRLSNNRITDKAAAALAQNKKLIWLALDNNLISDEGAFQLTQGNIIYLDLDRNNVADVGATWLARAKNIQYLLLNGNNIGDDGALAFANTARENVLELEIDDNNNISESTMNQIKQNKMIKIGVFDEFFADDASDGDRVFASKNALGKQMNARKSAMFSKMKNQR